MASKWNLRNQASGVRRQAPGIRDQADNSPLSPVQWLPGRRDDMVWNALVIVTALLPLSVLAIDVPRLFCAALAACRSQPIPGRSLRHVQWQ